MQSTKRKKAIGLDIGQTSAKLVVLSRSGKKAILRRAEVFSSRDEGIRGDDELELFNAVGGWLKDMKLGVPHVYLGMPQYMATTQVSDFTPGAKGEDLEKMVGFETMQLSGLSDERFLYDYHQMPPGNGRQNPVIIGIAREANLEDYSDRATSAGIPIDDIVMTGMAIANAFFELRPEALEEMAPQILLDVGVDSSTMVVVAGGQVLYVGGLMCGGQAFTQSIMRELGMTEDEAEKAKVSGTFDWTSLLKDPEPSSEPLPSFGDNDSTLPAVDLGDGDDIPVINLDPDDDLPVINLDADDVAPLRVGDLTVPKVTGIKVPVVRDEASDRMERLGDLLCFRSFKNEFTNNIEHWQSGEQEPLNATPVSKIWLSGGGSNLAILGEFLAHLQSCPVESYGPVVEKGGSVRPEFVAAYGLALQGIGCASLPISLAPQWLRWYHRKESRFPFLLIAFLMFFTCLIGGMAYSYLWLGSELETIRERKENIGRCLSKITELDSALGVIAYYQSRMLPFVDRGSRSGRFMGTLAELQSCMEEGDWCVYVGDLASYDSYREIRDKQKDTGLGNDRLRERERESRRGLGNRLGGLRTSLKPVVTEPEREELKFTDVMSIEPLTTMVAIGFTKKQYDPKTRRPVNNYETILALQNRLNRKADVAATPDADAYFAGVDSMTSLEYSGLEEVILEPWLRYLDNTMIEHPGEQPYLLGSRYNSHFILKLPFRTSDINKPPPPPDKDSKKKSSDKK
jgi:Tfp pilus assembly PilM family ATPase